MFVLKGIFENEPAYFVNINDKIPSGLTFIHLTTSINEATKFSSMEEAEEKYNFINNECFKIYPVCPVCNHEYEEPPAISRKDNKTKICSKCGTNEALDSFIKYNKTPND